MYVLQLTGGEQFSKGDAFWQPVTGFSGFFSSQMKWPKQWRNTCCPHQQHRCLCLQCVFLSEGYSTFCWSSEPPRRDSGLVDNMALLNRCDYFFFRLCSILSVNGKKWSKGKQLLISVRIVAISAYLDFRSWQCFLSSPDCVEICSFF